LWRKVADALEPSEVRVILPDIIGLGLSDKPTDARLHTLEQHAAWFGRLLDELSPGPFIFAAQDWGGPIGLRALADRPDLCAGMVLGNTVIGPPRPGFKANLFHRIAKMPIVSDALFRWGGFPQSTLFAVQGDKRSIQPFSWEARAYRWPLRDRAQNLAPLALARMVPDSPDHPSIDALQRCHDYVTSFGGPISLVWGLRDPILGRVINHVARALPNAHVTRTQAGHFLQEEVPMELAQAIRDVAGRAFAKRASAAN
jgi:haloalkane dehalogenase